MNNTLSISQNLRNLSIILLMMFCSGILKAQPGWQDHTLRYYYTILDENKKEISFKTNKDYRIMVNETLYQLSNIPQDLFKKAIPSDKEFQNQTLINDFSLSTPLKTSNTGNRELEIKIIYKKDTMFISQSTGKGSFVNEISPLQKNPKADFTLQFIAGHYYFPDWAKDILNNVPETKGNIKTVNISQLHFIVPKNTYESLFYTENKKDDLFAKADKYIVNNFMKGYFSVQTRNELTKFDKSVSPYKNPRWNQPFFPTKDHNRLFTMTDYSMDDSNCYSSTSIFSILNKKENTIELFFPKQNPRLFGSTSLYIDPYNTVLYLPVWTKKEFDYKLSDCQYNLPFENHVYTSKDEGKTWYEDKKNSELFKKYDLKQIEFLDKDYALAYSRKTINHKIKNTEIVQGTYYLLKNMQVTDSLKTPDDIYYNSNVNNYGFSVKNDTALLGRWTYDEYYSSGKTKYFQPLLRKVSGKWKFQIIEGIFSQSPSNLQENKDSVKEYQNFQLINKRELILKNGSGSLKLKQNVADKASDNGYLLLEKGKQIYLIDRSYAGSVYLSSDGGTTWYLYPLPLEERNYSYHFLEVDDQNELSYFSSEWIEGQGTKIRKIFHKFIKDK